MNARQELLWENFRRHMNTADANKDYDDLWNAIDALGDYVRLINKDDIVEPTESESRRRCT